MEILTMTIHILVALFMILVVLVQGGNQGGVTAAFGGGNTQGVFGAAGATSFLGKLTYGAAFVFMVTSISLAMMQGKGGRVGLGEKIKSEVSKEQPATPATDGQAPTPEAVPEKQPEAAQPAGEGK